MAERETPPDDTGKQDLNSQDTAELRAESVPQELTGRATRTGDDLAALFSDGSPDHLADGFSGGSDDDTGVAINGDGELPVDPAVPGPPSE